MARKSAKDRREALRQRQKQAVNDRDKKGLGGGGVLDFSHVEGAIAYFKPEENRDECIDIIPFEITQEWYAKLRSFSGRPTGLQPGDWDYKLEIPIHRYIGDENMDFLCPRLAFGKKCPICEEMFAEYEKEERNEKAIKALTPSWRNYYNVYNYNAKEDSTGLSIWANMSYHCFEKYLLQKALVPGNEEGLELDIVTFSDLEDGRSIEFDMRKEILGKNEFLKVGGIKFIERDAYNEDIVQEAIGLDALVVSASYDEMSRAHLGVDNPEESKQESTEAPKAEKKTRSRTRKPAASAKEEKSQLARRRSRTPEPESEPEPEAKEQTAEGKCPAGSTFGTDCNELNECIDCPEETFDACADEQERLKEAQKKEEAPPKRTRARTRK